MLALTINDLNNAAQDLQHIADLATSQDLTATDRLGTTKLTVKGALNTLKAFNVRGAFVGATPYGMKDVYTSAGISYVALVDHVSTTVAADLAAGKVTVHQGATREDLAAPDGSAQIGYGNDSVKTALDALHLADYAALRSYAGEQKSVYVTGYLVSAAPSGIAGPFTLDPHDAVTLDNNGTCIVDALGRRWKRAYVGATYLKWFAPVADGVANDYSVIVKAIGATGTGTLCWSAGTYLNATATLVQPPSQKWVGEGGQRVTTIVKGFNGDLVNVGDKGEIYDINLNGMGATFTGRGFYVPVGFSQRLERCRAQDCKAPALEYAANVGGGSHVSDFEGNTMDQTTVPAIKMGADTAPSPKFFDGIWLSGGLFDLSAGGNGSSLTNFYIRNFVTSGPIGAGGSALMHIANGRVASITDATTISGSDITFTGVAFSGPVYLDQAQGMRFAACSFGGGITENGATSNSNEYTAAGSYVPTWTQGSGTQPVIGNGTLLCEYARVGRVCTVNLRLVIGSTTTTGNNGPGYQFSLPFTATPDINQRGMYANVYDASAALDYPCSNTIPSNVNFFTISRNGNGVRDGFPIVWAVGDTIDTQFSYIVR